MMKIKKLIVIIISLLCFAGLAITLSLQQSQKADQILTNNGLSSPYYVFTPKKNISIKSFIEYLNKNSGDHLQVHFKSPYDSNRILIWANYNLKSQPMDKGSSRYFNKSDFTGKIPFAVISSETSDNIVTSQNNKYIQEGSAYYSVIGTLKQNNENPNGQTAYYLTTGVNQPTAHESIKNFKVTIDGLPKGAVTSLKKHLKAKVETVDYSKTYNKQHNISPTKKFIFAVICVVVGLINAAIWAILNNAPLKKIGIKNSIVVKLLGSSGIRFLFVNFVLLLLVYFLLPLKLFYSSHTQLFQFLFAVYLMEVLTFGLTMLLIHRRKENEDGAAK